MKEIIKVDNVTFCYGQEKEDKVKALSNISLSVYEGEFLALVGHNGSGKSTLAKLFNGLITPTSGTVRVFGKDTSVEENVMEVRRNVGMVFQNPDNQMVASIVEDDIAFGAENLGIPQKEIVERVTWALKSVGMYEYKDRTPHKLSGGQKQRIAIAGVLALLPKVIVLDESTAMLDPKGRKEVMDTVMELKRRDNFTVISITHFMDEVLNADRVIVLNGGEVAMMGTPNEIFADSLKLYSYGLDVPRVIGLAQRLRKAGIEIPIEATNAVALGEEICRLL
ncbi:MAG: energy-coupling factor transporter ATPase [Clostridia bacterium]